MNQKQVRQGFVLAAFMNVGGVLLFSQGFTNAVINRADPVVMSNFGLLMIAVWGLAYLAAAQIQANLKWLGGAFAIEKLVYVLVWIDWLSENSLAQLYKEDLFAGMFYSIYGANDLVFMLFFAFVFFRKPSHPDGAREA